MRTIAHISDIHFGDADPAVVESLREKISDLRPDLVAVSGDLTQRARSEQFRQARAFLDRLPAPCLVVPGNHDVPLYNVFNRFIGPLTKFKRHISAELAPQFCDEEIAVFGVNTARSLTIKGGRISDEQLEELLRKLSGSDEDRVKIVVTHHPFDLPEHYREEDIVGRAKRTLPRLVEAGIDIFLAGHLHVSHVAPSARRYRLENGYSALIVQAGTAASKRERGEENSFNLLEIDGPAFTVKRFQRHAPGQRFELAGAQQFSKSKCGWSAQ